MAELRVKKVSEQDNKATSEQAIIKLEAVSTVYEGERRTAINNVNLTVKRNELIYIVGPNAAGKTTLLETINGIFQLSREKLVFSA